MIFSIRTGVICCIILFYSTPLLAKELNSNAAEKDACGNGACDNEYIKCDGERCRNLKTDAWGWGRFGEISFTPVYENHYEINLLHPSESCQTESVGKDKKKTLPKYSFFRQTLDHDAQTPNATIVHVYEVDANAAADITKSGKDEFGLFDTPFKLCRNGTNHVQRSLFKRIGGVNTGILVVPFKVRQGDIFSDSTIGPYISYQWAVIEVLATGGLSQISVSEVGTDEVESKTGLTYAVGLNFEIDTNWDIALIAGKDRLSGNDGDTWKYQDDWWWSFAIGFNFTREN